MVTRHTISHADELYRGIARNPGANPDGRRGTKISNLYKVNFGAVAALDVDGIAAAQAVAGAGNLSLNGALASGGTVTLDVPRCIEVDTNNAGNTTQTATITGTDEYGHTMVEVLTLNGTTAVLGSKAFKTVTQIAISAAITGTMTAGTTDKLGLPYACQTADDIVSAAVDGSVEDATIVVADATNPATGTDGDVRGTVDFTQASNGTLRFSVLMEVDDTSQIGAYGVPQFAG